MARPLRIPPHLTLDELGQRYRRADDPVARSHWHIVWLLSGGTPTAEVARVTRYSVNWVREIARRYREDGPTGIGDRRHGNPGAPPLLDAVQQERLRAALGGPAPDGGLWTGRHVARWIGAAIGRPVDPARGWEWMRRLGFTPQRPRPRETRADPAAQDAFKKGGSPPRSPR
ncbi:MAG: winged helix-turn-helix domain-containing protein [Pseudonocardiaceae bacterium]